MKTITPLYFLILLSFVLSEQVLGSIGQDTIKKNSPETILWKITGKDCNKTSYLLGTFHLADAEWLYTYPEMKKVIDSTEYILTEAFTTEPVTVPGRNLKNKLKAIPLLTSQQYRMLDSFFVARVEEGIKGNQEAEGMTVSELEGAIYFALAYNTKGANGITKFMDLDLFTLYKKLGRKGDRLDRVAPEDFDSSQIDHARQHLTRTLGYIRNSDKPDWNIYHQTGLDQLLAQYKKMKFDYKLTETDNQIETSEDFDLVPLKIRNQNWMAKITSNISTRPCLIAVGLGHLYYQTGVISLLRKKGYTVEPVIFGKLD